MSKEVLEQVVLKASSDARFRAQLGDNFQSAIRPYDLTDEEKGQLQRSLSGAVGTDARGVDRNLAASHAASNEAMSHLAASNQAASNELASNQVASNEVASNEVASSEVASNNATTFVES